MKIYISADMEGIAGVGHWDETYKTKPDYNELREQMTAEVAAACDGALEAGAREILVQDAHDTGRNIIASKLPRGVSILKGWSNHPFSMVQEIDSSFDAVMFVGYHSPVSSNASPLAHTMNTNFTHFLVNGAVASEFMLHAYAAASVGVPSAFASGDEGLCSHAESVCPGIVTIGVKKGVGASVLSVHPQQAVEDIRAAAAESLRGNLKKKLLKLPRKWKVEMGFKDHSRAYKASFYPGMTLVSAHSVVFAATDYFEVLRMMLFVA